jgi:exopolysaccharide production protein ExoQ
VIFTLNGSNLGCINARKLIGLMSIQLSPPTGQTWMNKPSTFSAPGFRTASQGAPNPGVLMQLGFAMGLIVLMPAFVMQLAFDPVSMQFTSSRILQFAILFCGIYGPAMILTSREITNTVLRCRPLLLQIGFAFLSILWSYNPDTTFRASYVFLSTCLFGVAVAGRLSPFGALELIIRTLAFACLLSIIWVIFFPQQAVHQATDTFQFQHAGLWRGIFSHKQGLGVIAGITTGLLLFYGSMVFPSPIVRFGAISCSVSCVIGTQSATGLVTSIVVPTIFYITNWIALSPPPVRKRLFAILVAAISGLYGCFYIGLLDFVMPLLGKSTDLTGRTDMWPWVLDNIRNSGSATLGGGFASGWAGIVAPSISIDNGYIDLLVCFGYFGGAIIAGVYGWVLWVGSKLIFSARPQTAAIQIFPFSIMLVELFINITETSFMTKSINTILIVVAMYQITSYCSAARKASLPVRPSQIYNISPGKGCQLTKTADRGYNMS